MKLSKDDIGGVWPCLTCRNIAKTVTTLSETINTIVQLVQSQQVILDTLLVEQTSTGKQVKLLDKIIKDVRYEVNPDANMYDEEDEEEDEDMEPDGRLLIGDSLVRAIHSKNDDMSDIL